MGMDFGPTADRPANGSRWAPILATLGNDGFIIWKNTTTHSVAMTGAVPTAQAGKRGAMYAVYEFLDLLGVRFYSHDETLLPANVSTMPSFENPVVQPQSQVMHRSANDFPGETAVFATAFSLPNIRVGLQLGTTHCTHGGHALCCKAG